MNKKKKKDLRMYCLVPYNLSPIQQGIQSLHGAIEYGLQASHAELYREWATEHKTIIILNAGTTGPISTMWSHKKALDKLGVTHSIFREPDLNNAVTAIAFIVDTKEDQHITGYLKQIRLA